VTFSQDGVEGRISMREANDRKENSCCHIKRLKRIIARDRPVALVHGNRARRSGNSVGLELRHKIVALSLTLYARLTTRISQRGRPPSKGFGSVGKRSERSVEMRGLLCSRPAQHRSRRFRRYQDYLGISGKMLKD